ncbi:MAG: Txe/YoeB family addiction module toxin [Bacteroidaceae bacterium]|nr:Txe/YoeB family addiction module toxin [Bacteroidaceae bacterium]
MNYRITFAPQAKEDIAKLKRNEPAAFEKVVKLLNEIVIHPKTGTGHPEPLKGKPENRWSRAITKKHRLVYRIFEAEVYVDVLTAYGHYNDK